MDEQVCGESGRALEGFPTHLALKAFLLRVDVHVLLQTDCMAERFSADVAAKRPRPAVRSSDVNLQTMRRGEHLVTGDAVVGVGCWGVVGAAVQRLLRRGAAAQVGAVQVAGVLQNCGGKTHLTELKGGGPRLPGVRWLEVRRES